MEINFEKGLVPAIVQDATSGEVLMLAFMNEEAWRETIATGHATFFSRTRNKLWRKGESSGHRLRVREAKTDCDRDAIVLKVDLLGPGVCHEGYKTCFFRTLENQAWVITEQKVFNPEEVYT